MDDMTVVAEPLTLSSRLEKDLKEAAKLMSTAEVRFLCDVYGDIQKFRIASTLRGRKLQEQSMPCAVTVGFAQQTRVLENRIKHAMDIWSSAQPAGAWMKSIYGIGPVISSGVMAHIDFAHHEGAFPTASSVWAHAGLRPGQRRERGKKIDFSPSFKRLCFLMGECFVKVSGYEADFYGKLYVQRKAYEQDKNERLEYREQAESILKAKDFGKDTIARQWYEAGKLPPGHIHQRAMRYAVKMFLSHAWAVMYELKFQKTAPNVWVIDHGHHTDKVAIPNWPM